ncbi:MAG: alpha/beta fold hydrolase [Arenimonas sp.]|uniref:esterase/lipase family protein n=1 Tax=Arenimonas sp. TaxID=1872635 RepID=UPI0025BDFF40|nr:alpha/beta fold hydrolase [Arenimonas sp.]MBW8366501.1 alpha/beta fold hydrolase [Arenimonas sp.]
MLPAGSHPSTVLSSQPTEHVVLLHGVWMRGLTLVPLARRLQAQGFVTHRFDYASLFSGPAPSVDRLASYLIALGPGPVHLVGHSLGGLVALETLASYRGLPPGRVVCLGSPLAGSGAARGLSRHHLSALLGRSGTLLRSGLHELPQGREVGVLAGSRAAGLGRLFNDLDGPGDGTVCVWETQLPGLADHRVLRVSHTGLILSRAVAGLTAEFLRQGRFPR